MYRTETRAKKHT